MPVSSRDTPTTVGELREAIAGRHDQEPVAFVIHTPQECCPGHVHDMTELYPGLTEIQTYGNLTIHLKDVSA